MKTDKKKFGETGFGEFLKKAVKVLPDLAGTAFEVAANPANAIAIVRNALQGQDKSNPEVQKLMMEFREKEMDFDREMATLEQQDKESARELQKEALKSDGWLAQHFIYILSAIVITAAIGFGYALFFWEIPGHNKRMIEMFADIFLFSGAIMVLQFFLGGSFRNKNKQNVE